MQELLSGRDSELLTSFYAENMLYGDNHKANIFLKMIPYKGQLFNKGEENLLNKEIAENKVIKKWEKGFYNGDIQNTEEINHTKEQIKYLALHYTKNGELSPEKAVKKATEEIIGNRYMSVAGSTLQIPKQIIDGNKIEDLNEDYIDASLAELKAGIINGNVPYFRGNEPDSIYAKEMVEDALRGGKWNLTPDKKSVYFSFLTRDGNYIPLKSEQGQLLKFNLLDLNNPDALEQQKQQFSQALTNAPFEY
ncbi:MAG TPA: hypothetical protein LFW21_01770 [Rickettsia endosymbiont of Pyrocoelia pectoralis]|nr:hypothetical protein [Rickettsia endosymbiont of Pyrocoelia pectoralis]